MANQRAHTAFNIISTDNDSCFSDWLIAFLHFYTSKRNNIDVPSKGKAIMFLPCCSFSLDLDSPFLLRQKEENRYMITSAISAQSETTPTTNIQTLSPLGQASLSLSWSKRGKTFLTSLCSLRSSLWPSSTSATSFWMRSGREQRSVFGGQVR